MPDLKRIEYRVRKVERYIVTRYEESDAGAASEMIGEYPNHTTAHAVGYALCNAEHQRLGWDLDDERIQYPCSFPTIGPESEDPIASKLSECA